MGLYLQFNYTARKFHCQALGVKLKGFGEYMAKIHLEVKNRPVYICADSNIDSENN